jgi:hypothetical protein
MRTTGFSHSALLILSIPGTLKKGGGGHTSQAPHFFTRPARNINGIKITRRSELFAHGRLVSLKLNRLHFSLGSLAR